MMQIQDFVRVYQAKSDEELVQLMADQGQLTAEARLALESELSRRQISVGEISECFQDDESHHGSARAVSSAALQACDRQNVSDFVVEVLRTYHCHFWLFFRITAPAVIIGMIAILTARNEVQEILRPLPRGFEMLAYHTEMLEIWLVNCSAWLVSWMAFSYMFGATCIAVEESVAGFTPSAWRSFLNVRERLGSFLCLSLLLFGLGVMAVATSMLVGTGVFWILRQGQAHPSRLLITLLSYGTTGLAFLVLSRFALAVPAVLLDDFSVGEAMFRSDKLTQGKWLTLAVLLAKSIIGGYVAGMLPFWLAFYVRVTTPLPSWFPWILTVASIIGVTVVEPTMFVGYALLYLKMSPLDSDPSEVLTSQLA